MKGLKPYAPFALRLGIGGLFLVAGIMKLVNPGQVTQMLADYGLPLASSWAWLLILFELVCGAAVLVGYKIKWVTPPLAVILVVAILLTASEQPMSGLVNIALIAGIVSLWLSGPGKLGLDKR